VQLGFNLSNRVTVTLESSSILIYVMQVTGIYTWKDTLIKTRVLINKIQKGVFAKLIKTYFNLGEVEGAMCEF
jgi:hypothetical protein